MDPAEGFERLMIDPAEGFVCVISGDTFTNALNQILVLLINNYKKCEQV